MYLQASLEASVEEPAVNEEAKSSEVDMKADEKKTDEKKEEENNAVAMDTIKKEEPRDSKLKCHNNMCQVPFKISMNPCSFFLFLNAQK